MVPCDRHLCTDMCLGMCIDMRTDVCLGMCLECVPDMCLGMRVDMRTDMCLRDVFRHAVSRHNYLRP